MWLLPWLGAVLALSPAAHLQQRHSQTMRTPRSGSVHACTVVQSASANTGLSALLAKLALYAELPLEDAQTFPPDAYTSNELFQAETDKIFRPGWQCIAHASQVPTQVCTVPTEPPRCPPEWFPPASIRCLPEVTTARWTSSAS